MTRVYRKLQELQEECTQNKKVLTDRFSDIHNHNKGVIEFFPGIYIENNYDFIEIKSNIKKIKK